MAYPKKLLNGGGLGPINVFGLQTLGTLLYLEFHFRALFKRAVARHLNRGKVHEHILAAGALDEAIAFGGVKPFHNTLFSHYFKSPISFPANSLMAGTSIANFGYCLMQFLTLARKKNVHWLSFFSE